MFQGKAGDQGAFSKAGPFQKQNHWISETPAYKIRVTVNGDKGDAVLRVPLRRRRHREDGVLVNGVSEDVQKIKGKWLITKMIGSIADSEFL